MPSDILVVRGGVKYVASLAQALGEDYIIHHETNEAAAQLSLPNLRPDAVLFFPAPGNQPTKYDFCSMIKALPLTQDLPVVVMSGRSSLMHKTKAFAAGAADYLVKPFAPLEVKTCISSLIALTRARRKIHSQHTELGHIKFIFLKGMASLAETRDPETGDHLLRVSRYVKILATRMRDQNRNGEFSSREAIAELSRAAILHDIGKVGVPDNILLKPDKLTPEEFEVMKQHAMYGERIIKKLLRVRKSNAFLIHAAEIAGGHHECWDGSGYPRGLHEEEIPLSARLMAVADVYDSIISPRIYKMPRAHRDAVQFIMDHRGSKFDPVIAGLFYQEQRFFQDIARSFVPQDMKMYYQEG